jgi:glycerol uptake facilitator protein
MEAATTIGRHARASWRRTTGAELLSELLGTFVLIRFGDRVVAMAVAALNQSGRGTDTFAASGDWLIIGWGWGFAVAFGGYIAGGISGVHINPAVTLAYAARRGFPGRKVPGYIAAQVVGAFLGALLVYLVYKGAIDS